VYYHDKQWDAAVVSGKWTNDCGSGAVLLTTASACQHKVFPRVAGCTAGRPFSTNHPEEGQTHFDLPAEGTSVGAWEGYLRWGFTAALSRSSTLLGDDVDIFERIAYPPPPPARKGLFGPMSPASKAVLQLQHVVIHP
jgi:hypothetical protein